MAIPGVISASANIVGMSEQFKKSIDIINTAMDNMTAAKNRVNANSRGEMFTQFEQGERVWASTGLDNSGVADVVRNTSYDYYTGMQMVDKKGAAGFSV
jgi:hypothetical protein